MSELHIYITEFKKKGRIVRFYNGILGESVKIVSLNHGILGKN